MAKKAPAATGKGIGLSVTGSDPNAKKPSGGGFFVQGTDPRSTAPATMNAETSKADAIRSWFAEKCGGEPTAPSDIKWKDVKEEIKQYLEGLKLVWNEKSDYLAFLKYGQEGGWLEKGTSRKSATTSGEVSLKQFAVLTQNIDPAVLADAIKVISQVGGVDNAKALAKKWAELCEAIGEDNARKAIEVL